MVQDKQASWHSSQQFIHHTWESPRTTKNHFLYLHITHNSDPRQKKSENLEESQAIPLLHFLPHPTVWPQCLINILTSAILIRIFFRCAGLTSKAKIWKSIENQTTPDRFPCHTCFKLTALPWMSERSFRTRNILTSSFRVSRKSRWQMWGSWINKQYSLHYITMLASIISLCLSLGSI